ncbi:thioredoxin-disulfide reductase [candidate division WOR-3 bacterium]|nr:thioredoxin-disulfide reductase [candidate division WOR-3 bacterium]
MAIETKKDLIIIGGGPAGLTAGIYAARARLNTLLIEKLMPGGLAATTDRIENYPGFQPISGMELTKKMVSQAKEFGVEIITEEVVCLKIKDKFKLVKTVNTKYKTPAIIIATGTLPKKLNIPGEDELRGKGVSYCATCDGPLFRDKDIIVIGCGNSGIQEGLFLLKFVNRITFVEFLPYMTAEKVLQERIQKEQKIKFYLEHTLISINGEQTVSSVTIKDRKTTKEKIIEAQGVFIYAGLFPNTNFLKGVVKLDKEGYVITNEDLETSISGIFAAGDVRAKTLRQIATSVGDGALAAFMAEKYIERRNYGRD